MSRNKAEYFPAIETNRKRKLRKNWQEIGRLGLKRQQSQIEQMGLAIGVRVSFVFDPVRPPEKIRRIDGHKIYVERDRRAYGVSALKVTEEANGKSK